MRILVTNDDGIDAEGLHVLAQHVVAAGGLRWARLAAFGAVRAAIAPAEADGRLHIELRATDEQLSPDSDTALCEAGYATLTTLVGIAEAWPVARAISDVTQRPVPGAAFSSVHAVPDVSDSHTLHSRERA